MFNEDVRVIPVKMGRLVSASQAGAILDVDERTVRRMIARGQLDGVSIGSRRYATRKSVLRAADGRP